MTTVSFIIPSYNSEETLKQCLDSLLQEDVLDDIEIVIVNDGSTDSTSEIAQAYADKHPAFRVINKANGGHGSAINCAVSSLRGRYFRVLDSDDWVRNLPVYVKSLKSTDAQVVLTPYRMINVVDGTVQEYSIKGLEFGRVYDLAAFFANCQQVADVCALHGITYDTAFYRACNLTLSEKVSYEDLEFTVLPFANVESILPLDIFLYEYGIGYPNQSMSESNQIKRIHQLATVLFKIIDSPPPATNKPAWDYYFYRVKSTVLTYHVIALIRNPDKANGRKLAREFRKQIKQRDTYVHKATRRSFWYCYILSFTGFTTQTMARWRNTRIYKFFGRRLR